MAEAYLLYVPLVVAMHVGLSWADLKDKELEGWLELNDAR